MGIKDFDTLVCLTKQGMGSFMCMYTTLLSVLYAYKTDGWLLTKFTKGLDDTSYTVFLMIKFVHAI